jgi:uncharacterized Zn finger protein (UPF0148 family)
MKYCPKCGVQCEDDQLFCAKCGSPLPVNVNIEAKTEEVKEEPVVETVAEPVEEVVAEEVAEEATANSEPVEEPKAEEPEAATEVLDKVFAEEPAPAPERKLNVGMLVWSIINLALWFTPFAIVSLIMTIVAKNSAPEESAKKIKFAVIFNVLGTVCGFFNTLISIIATIIRILEKM